MSEEWRPIEGFPHYEVRNHGRVKSLARVETFTSQRKNGPVTVNRKRRETILSAGVGDHGYLQVMLCHDGVTSNRALHVLVCRAFHGSPPSPKHEVAHGDNNRLNPRAENLRWATRKENVHDKRGHGTHRQGSGVPWAKLTEAQIPGIRARLALGESPKSIAAGLGVSQNTIYGIKLERNWKHA